MTVRTRPARRLPPGMVAHGQIRRLAQGHDQSHRAGPWAQPALLPTPDHQRRQLWRELGPGEAWLR